MSTKFEAMTHANILSYYEYKMSILKFGFLHCLFGEGLSANRFPALIFFAKQEV